MRIESTIPVRYVTLRPHHVVDAAVAHHHPRRRLILEPYYQFDGYEMSDGGQNLIATNVQSMSAGHQGNIAFVTTSGVKH